MNQRFPQANSYLVPGSIGVVDGLFAPHPIVYIFSASTAWLANSKLEPFADGIIYGSMALLGREAARKF